MQLPLLEARVPELASRGVPAPPLGSDGTRALDLATLPACALERDAPASTSPRAP